MKRRRIAYLMMAVFWVALVMSKVTVVTSGQRNLGVFLEWGRVRLASEYDSQTDLIHIGFTFYPPR